MYVLRSISNEDIYYFGVKFIDGQYIWLLTLQSGAIDDLFGKAAYEAMLNLPQDRPVEFDIHQFAAQEAVTQEREECAKLVESWEPHDYIDPLNVTRHLAQMIREREKESD